MRNASSVGEIMAESTVALRLGFKHADFRHSGSAYAAHRDGKSSSMCDDQWGDQFATAWVSWRTIIKKKLGCLE